MALIILIESDQRAVKIALPRERLCQPDMRGQPGEAFVIRRLVQAAIQSRGTYLQSVCRRDRVFDIEDHADLIADGDAILVSHAAGFININSQNLIAAPAGHFDMNQFESFARSDSLSDFNYPGICFHNSRWPSAGNH